MKKTNDRLGLLRCRVASCGRSGTVAICNFRRGDEHRAITPDLCQQTDDAIGRDADAVADGFGSPVHGRDRCYLRSR